VGHRAAHHRQIEVRGLAGPPYFIGVLARGRPQQSCRIYWQFTSSLGSSALRLAGPMRVGGEVGYSRTCQGRPRTPDGTQVTCEKLRPLASSQIRCAIYTAVSWRSNPGRGISAQQTASAAAQYTFHSTATPLLKMIGGRGFDYPKADLWTLQIRLSRERCHCGEPLEVLPPPCPAVCFH